MKTMWNSLRALLTLGIVVAMILGVTSAAFAQEVVEEEAPAGEEVVVDETRPLPRDEELPPAPEPAEPEPTEPIVVEPGIEEPMVISPPDETVVIDRQDLPADDTTIGIDDIAPAPGEETVISPASGAETDSGLSGWEQVAVVGAVIAALVIGVGLGAYFMRGYDKTHPIAH